VRRCDIFVTHRSFAPLDAAQAESSGLRCNGQPHRTCDRRAIRTLPLPSRRARCTAPCLRVRVTGGASLPERPASAAAAAPAAPEGAAASILARSARLQLHAHLLRSAVLDLWKIGQLARLATPSAAALPIHHFCYADIQHWAEAARTSVSVARDGTGWIWRRHPGMTLSALAGLKAKVWYLFLFTRTGGAFYKTSSLCSLITTFHGASTMSACLCLWLRLSLATDTSSCQDCH